MAKRTSIVDDAIAVISARKVRRGKWHENVAEEHRETIAELRQAWLDGRLGNAKRAAAHVIAKLLNERGIATVGYNGVEAWLEETP